MSAYSSADIRNIALVGHGSSGKTSLAEAMLHGAGAIPELGTIERGSTVCDFEPEEKHRHHSLASAIASLDHDGCHINLIDTPGYPDFLGRTLPAFSAVETAVVVIDARGGVQATTRKLMDSARERGLCRLVVVNKIDAPDVDLEAVLAEIQDVFGPECLPINLPHRDGNSVVDCFFEPEAELTAFSSVDLARGALLDQVIEMDEELMEAYLEEGEDLGPERLHGAFTQALREGHLVPVCFTVATSEVGVPHLLTLLSRMMPNPAEGNPIALRISGQDSMNLAPDPAADVIAHVFKVHIDPFVGKLSAFRIHQGTVSKDSQLFAGDARKPFRVSHLFRLQGKDHVEVERGVPGDICAVAKIDEIAYGSVLSNVPLDECEVTALEVPEPMYGLAIEAKSRGDEQKISDALAKLAAEDPTFRVEHDATTQETVVRGLGELHLQLVLEDLKDRYHVDVESHPPRIAYRETITRTAEGHHRHKKQTGGAGQFAEVALRVEALPRGAGYEFVDKVVGGVIPSQFIPAVEKGVRQALEAGIIAGYPMEDLQVTVYDGKHHAVDSKEIAFVQAGKKAFMDAVRKASPIILEPIVDIEISAPQANMGDIAGDLAGKRGRVAGTESGGGGTVTVTGQVPLAELGSFPSELKSVTAGAGSYSVQLSHYDPVPRPVQERLMSAFQPPEEET